MLFRPLGRSGQALSALCLRLNWESVRHNAHALQKLIITGLENGVNHYHFDYIDQDLMREMAKAIGSLNRRLLFISATAHSHPNQAEATSYALTPLRERLRVAIKSTGLETLDMVLFENPLYRGISDESLAFMRSLREAKMVRYLGAEAPDSELMALIESDNFHILRTGFDLDTTWEKRHLLDKAIAHGLSIFGKDYFPAKYRVKADVVPKAAQKTWFFKKPENPLAGAGTYAFLYDTPDWTAEELCLGYALHQTSLTSVVVDVTNPEELEALALVPERYLPPSVPAQIEMARFTLHPPKSA